jgi:transposase
MQVLYQRCAAVDVGKDVIAVAVRLPGDGPDGRQTVKRKFKTFYGVLLEAARWLVWEGVTHVAMEATGIYSMPVYHALLEHGDLREGAGVQRRARQERPGPQDRPGRR